MTDGMFELTTDYCVYYKVFNALDVLLPRLIHVATTC